MTAARAELLKWVGLASMLVDHAARYLHVALPGWLWIGRLAFPCFAVALAAQVSSDRRLAVARRLVVAAALVFPLQWYASGVAVVSVLATLGGGLALAWCVVRAGRLGVLGGVLVLLLSLWVEYGAPGVLLVAGCSLLSDADDFVLPGAVGMGAGVAGLWLVGGDPVAVALAWVAVYVVVGGLDVPRVKGLFLKSYFAQWAVLGVVRLLS